MRAGVEVSDDECPDLSVRFMWEGQRAREPTQVPENFKVHTSAKKAL